MGAPLGQRPPKRGVRPGERAGASASREIRREGEGQGLRTLQGSLRPPPPSVEKPRQLAS